MKTRLFIPLVLMVLAPLGLLAWLGSSITRNERTQREQQLEALLSARLQDMDSRVAAVLAERQRHIIRLSDNTLNPAALQSSLAAAHSDPQAQYAQQQQQQAQPQQASAQQRELTLRSHTERVYREATRDTGFVRSFFLLDPSGALVYPSPYSPNPTSEERLFLQRTRRIWVDRILVFGQVAPQTPGTSDPARAQAQTKKEEQRPTSQFVGKGKVQATMTQSVPTRGWHAWYWEEGLALLFWYRTETGHIVGAELNRTRLLADVIAALPQTTPQTDATTRIGLHDASDQPLYWWGQYLPEDDEAPRAELPLSAPLSSWSLKIHMSPEAVERAVGGGAAAWVGSLVAMGVVLSGLGVYFYRESTRALREAGLRVSFVNQVSHELRTPLTNIRMYAELLAARVPDDDAKARRHLEVVVGESERLSRLIGNVLTFAREQRGRLQLRPREIEPDCVIADTLERLGPVLQQRGINTSFQRGGGGTMRLDSDVLEQVLVNLASNVEKYAATGGVMRVTSSCEGDTLLIRVEDEGPGIAQQQAEQIFQPFQRLGDALTEGAAGTGIGLTIARSLARLHGGDLRLLASESGARFELRLKAATTEEAK